jgi:hypothetical protein
MKTYIASIIVLVGLAATSSCHKPKNLFECIPDPLETNLIFFTSFKNASLNEELSGLSFTNHNTNACEDRFGNANCARQFNNMGATSSFINFTTTMFLNGRNTFSVSLWYKPEDDNSPTSKFETLLSRGDGPVTVPDRVGDWSIALYDCRKAVFSFGSGLMWDNQVTPSSNPTPCETEHTFLTDQWHHLVVTCNNGVLKLYRNGVLSSYSSSYSGGAAPINVGDLFVGKNFTGRIDDIMIYDKVLSLGEINSLKSAPSCCK